MPIDLKPVPKGSEGLAPPRKKRHSRTQSIVNAPSEKITNKHAVGLFIGVLIVVACISVLVLRLTSRGVAIPGCPSFQETDIRINEQQQISVGIADTPETRQQGLSGCSEVPEGYGLLFVLDSPQIPGFWMKDMLIPIDIVWINNGQVVGVETNVQPPENGTKDSDLPGYSPPGLVTHVLELAAGGAEKLGITTQTEIDMN